MTDRELLRTYVSTLDPEPLGAFLGRYQDSLVRFVGALLDDDAAAQDIVQETLLRAARHPKRLLRVSSCHNYLLRVARNLVVDHHRQRARAHRQELRHAERRRAEARSAERDGAATAEGAIEREELRARVRREIAALEPRLRELVLLKVQEEKTYREIAGITGLTATNVGYLLHRAMKILAFRLRDVGEEIP